MSEQLVLVVFFLKKKKTFRRITWQIIGVMFLMKINFTEVGNGFFSSLRGF